MNNKIDGRLRLLREEHGYSQQKVADLIGISDTTYQNYEYAKRNIPGKLLIELAKLYDVSVDYLLGISSVRHSNNVRIPTTSDFVDVPVYGSIAAGTPIEMIEVEETFPLAKEIYDQYPDAFLLKVKGESMNRILPNGCYALVDPCEDVDHDNKPYAVCVNGYDATIKRVRKLGNGFELVPDSTDPTYKPQVYDYGEDGTETITIIGRVVYHVLPFDWCY